MTEKSPPTGSAVDSPPRREPRMTTGRARRHRYNGFTDALGQFPSELHMHADQIYNCIFQAQKFIAEFIEKPQPKDPSDLEEAIIYIQTAQDQILDGLLKTLDDGLVIHISFQRYIDPVQVVSDVDDVE